MISTSWLNDYLCPIYCRQRNRVHGEVSPTCPGKCDTFAEEIQLGVFLFLFLGGVFQCC